MTKAIADLTVSVERPFDAGGDALFAALSDPAHFGGVERVGRDDDHVPENDTSWFADDPPNAPGSPDADETTPDGDVLHADGSRTRRAAGGDAGPPQVRPGETYVSDLTIPVAGVDGSTYETYFTVERTAEHRLVLVGGGDAPWGSFDARVVVAVADVQSGSVVRVDAAVDVAGDAAAAGPRRVRDGVADVIERYLSGIECGFARSA